MEFRVEDFPEEQGFQLRLQIALLINAKNIMAVSERPERFQKYIEERRRKIREIVQSDGNFVVYYGGREIYRSCD
ncbi:hypothetical protein GCM10007108_05950 [Thermogymnomonas acidicola]|uniref:Uncharacterized protein n=1 Tax=Thermogymnomonas acidicola TaxID=399579 RepID=A0AA37BQQ8_9ARCH|nr:hypothetical protein [Thermogymnomonas acidicola]GGM70721.1 hypothetical protein GCM10007108_05950 [Thermogymnomonas acidicola]